MSDQQPASSDQHAPAELPGEAGMTGGELAEAKRYGRLELACAGRQGPRRGLSGRGGVSAGPARSTTGCKTCPLAGGQLVAAAGGAVPGGDGDPRRRVVSAVVLLGPRAGASLPAEHADVRPLAVAVREAEPAGRGVLAGAGAGAVLADLDDRRLVVAGGGRGVLRRQRSCWANLRPC